MTEHDITNAWILRHDDDRRMYHEVYELNEYGVPDDMAGMLVLDIGANIGTFSRLCAERGAKVYAVEPSLENYKVLQENLAAWPFSVALARRAAGTHDGVVTLYTCINPTAFSLLKVDWHDTKEEVPVARLENIARAAMEVLGGDHIDLCKIDAEGAEYLLVPDYDFAPIWELAIEFHGCFVPDYELQAEVCRKRLASLGFREVEWKTTHPECGWLRLYRGKR